jgi:hypothetical protein
MIFGDIRTMIDKLFYTYQGQLIVSSIIGLGISLLFHRVCKDNCTAYYAPYIEEVKDQVFRLEDTCYKYTPYVVQCQEDKIPILNPYDVNKKPDNKIVVKIRSNLAENEV